MKKKFVAGIAASTTALSVLAGGTVGAAETKAYTKVIKDYYTVVNGKEETRKDLQILEYDKQRRHDKQ